MIFCMRYSLAGHPKIALKSGISPADGLLRRAMSSRTQSAAITSGSTCQVKIAMSSSTRISFNKIYLRKQMVAYIFATNWFLKI